FAVWGKAVFDSRYGGFHPRQKNRLQEARDLRAEQVSWLDFDTSLTPYQFLISNCINQDAEIYQNVLRLQYLLVIIYLADSVRYSSGVFVATFSGSERAEVMMLRAGAAATTENPSLPRLFVWAYSGRAVDKLPTLRSVIAATL